MQLSIIISTYNSEALLYKVLLGYSIQNYTDFEVIIADDGSTDATKQVVASFANAFRYPIKHVWQEDIGFRKCKILNKAIVASEAAYLIFSDGDCIPRQDFVYQHYKRREKGYFLSGGYYKLTPVVTNSITSKSIEVQDCFNVFWLIKNGLKLNFKITKLIRNRFFSSFMNWVTPTKASWNGHNSSGFKEDLVAINGFNELLAYGGEDRELGERLSNLGLNSKQIRYLAVCIHLHHERKYVDLEKIKFNLKIRNYNKKNKIIKIENGIRNLIE
ncbi:glycosyltransferase family 2 protein [Flavobacterium sp.]|uniref:glycosyltransferase family 2 protein n=1 Tax=Flavobacterium sp. TaxID=239 RepID=UPI000EDCFC19|nr:glycosyltransferase family 2 protein [Flavobacterium sp.]HCQ13246.1 glycosyl transferase family 2 [Flavobacterium sp.]